MRLRAATAPLDRVVELTAIDDPSTVLDWGCGHGLVSLRLAVQLPEANVVGVDPDDAKLSVARRAATQRGVSDRLTFREISIDDRPSGTWDAIVIVDVLYLLSATEQEAVLCAAASSLAPGGRLVVKELDDRPRVKAAFTRIQEFLATRVLRITKGVAGKAPTPSEIADVLRRCGLDTITVDLSRGYHVAHASVVATRR